MHDTVVFNSRRAQRAQRVQAGRHALIGVTLALAGMEAFQAGHGTWADGIGVIGGTVLLIAFVREVRAARHGSHASHHGVGWIDIFAAVVTAVEAWHLHHQGKHGLPIAYGLVAVLLLGIGLAYPYLARLRRLIVTPDGFDIRMNPFRRVRAAWTEVAAVTAVGTAVSVTMLDGRSHRFDFVDADNRDTVIETFARAWGRLSPTATPSLPGGADAPVTVEADVQPAGQGLDRQ